MTKPGTTALNAASCAADNKEYRTGKNHIRANAGGNRVWTADEDEALRQAVLEHSVKKWDKVKIKFEKLLEVLRSATPKGEGGAATKPVEGKAVEPAAPYTIEELDHRWFKVLKSRLSKRPWTPEEDTILVQLVKEHGPQKWSVIAHVA